MSNCNIVTSAIVALLFGAAGLACAGTATTNLQVTATVPATCTIGTTSVAFGNYDPNVATATVSKGTVTITCTKGANGIIGLDTGAHASGQTRQMSAGGTITDLLSYELYKPDSDGIACAGLSTVWGTAGTNTFAPGNAPTKAARTYSVCGRITAGQDVTAASYSDTVIATVTF